jgi:purine nucleosidase/pyrimidine-specific ribonucleoside hydrolase
MIVVRRPRKSVVGIDKSTKSYCLLIDSMPVTTAIDPSLISIVTAKVGVETKGELALGMNVMDTRNHFQWSHLPDIKVAYRAYYRRFPSLVMDTVLV